MLRVLKRKLYPIVSKYFSHATIVEGTLRGTECSFRCLLIDNSPYKEVLQSRMYEASPRILRRWSIWNRSIINHIRNSSEKLDMCVAILPLSYDQNLEKMCDFKSQRRVLQSLDISDSWENIRRLFHKNPIEVERKIRKHNFSSKISNSMEDFDLFFHRMYLPLIDKQFRNSSLIDSYQRMKGIFLNGFLLFVMEDSKAIAGGLCFIKDNVLYFEKIGVLDAGETYLKKGAQSAVYYFVIRHAKDLGLQKVDLTTSRSFLNDGVYRHKREWGAAAYPDDKSSYWMYFFNLGCSEKIFRFFERNPVIINTEEGLKGVVGIEREKELTIQDKRELSDRFYSPGLKSLLVMTPHSDKMIEIPFEGYLT